MQHVAIDLGGRESQICVRRENGEIVEERRIATAGIPRFLRRTAFSRVILETAVESFRFADEALALGHQVRVVPAMLVRSLGVGARGIKTDERDARALSEASCRMDLPSVHIRSQQARELKSICNLRDGLVSAQTMLINGLRSWLRGHGLRVATGATSSFVGRVRAVFQGEDQPIPAAVERQLLALEVLREQIRAADRDLLERTRGNEVCRRLCKVPGVGPVTAIRFVAAIDDVSRFADAHAVQSYLGLTPGENSSSSRKRRTSITKAGDPRLRSALIQAAWAARRCRRIDRMVHWSLEIEKRRGKWIAIVALARKISGVLFALWRDGSTYDPGHQMR